MHEVSRRTGVNPGGEVSKGLVVGINASRNRSGGAKAHLIGILHDSNPEEHGIRRLHVWSYKSLLDELPDTPFLVKHNPPELEQSLPRQVWWERRQLPREAEAAGCQVLLNTDAGSVCRFHPSVVMSRDMLSYDKREMARYGFSALRVRSIILRFLQTRSLKCADGALFLTRYAAKAIQETTGRLGNVAIIPHGVGENFRQQVTSWADDWSREAGKRIRCVYVSNAELYKHQWTVVRAVGSLRRKGFDLSLLLVGGGIGRPMDLLNEEIALTDPGRAFVETEDFVRHDEIPSILAKADIFIFASSCENMPNTLVEAMAAGLPIACADRGPMPEVLRDGGLYFDPEDAASIADAVERIITDREMRAAIARRAKSLSEQYSWRKCGDMTWEFLRSCAMDETGRGGR